MFFLQHLYNYSSQQNDLIHVLCEWTGCCCVPVYFNALHLLYVGQVNFLHFLWYILKTPRASFFQIWFVYTWDFFAVIYLCWKYLHFLSYSMLVTKIYCNTGLCTGVSNKLTFLYQCFFLGKKYCSWHVIVAQQNGWGEHNPVIWQWMVVCKWEQYVRTWESKLAYEYCCTWNAH